MMSLNQYNQLMSNMLNERHVLAKLRAELEGITNGYLLSL